MSWLAVIFIGFSSIAAFGSNRVLLQEPSASNLDYAARIKAHPEFKTVAEIWQRKFPRAHMRKQLLNDFIAAQELYLKSNFREAVPKFIEIVEQALSEDWSSTERQIFLQSFMRLAQLEPEKQDQWLKQSLAFDPHTQLDEEQFSPPLLERRRQLQNEVRSVPIQPANLGAEWTLLLINGQPCSPDLCPTWPSVDSKVRVTWLSNKWQTQTQMLKVEDLQRAQPLLKAWVRGDCGSQEFSAAAQVFEHRQAFVGDECVAPVATADLKNLSSRRLATQPNEVVFPSMPDEKKSRQFYKSPWFWTGVGVVVATLIVHASQKKSNAEPTTTYGY